MIFMWSWSGEYRERKPTVCIDGKEHLECNEKEDDIKGTNCAIDSYRITYSHLPVSDLQIMCWDEVCPVIHIDWLVCFTVHNCRFNQILASRNFSHLRAVFQEYSKVRNTALSHSLHISSFQTIASPAMQVWHRTVHFTWNVRRLEGRNAHHWLVL